MLSGNSLDLRKLCDVNGYGLGMLEYVVTDQWTIHVNEA